MTDQKKLTKKEREQLANGRRSKPWRDSIVEFLAKNGPATDLEIYDATRPDRPDISKQKKIHNVASQLTYLRDDKYVLIRDNDKIVLIADPNDNLYPGAEKYLDRS